MNSVDPIRNKDDSDLRQLFENLSSKLPERIEGFGILMHKEIDANESSFKDAAKMHKFTDLLVGSCIKAATNREKGHQASSCIEPAPVATSERIIPRQEDSISYSA